MCNCKTVNNVKMQTACNGTGNHIICCFIGVVSAVNGESLNLGLRFHRLVIGGFSEF